MKLFVFIINALLVVYSTQYCVSDFHLCTKSCLELYPDLLVSPYFNINNNCCECYNQNKCLNCNYRFCEIYPCHKDSDCPDPLFPDCVLKCKRNDYDYKKHECANKNHTFT